MTTLAASFMKPRDTKSAKLRGLGLRSPPKLSEPRRFSEKAPASVLRFGNIIGEFWYVDFPMPSFIDRS